jgi:hypothetical protein
MIGEVIWICEPHHMFASTASGLPPGLKEGGTLGKQAHD